MKKRRILIGVSAVVIVAGGIAWYLWDHRPIDVLDIDPEQVTQVVYVFDGNVYDAVHIEEPEDIRQFCQLLNQMVVRKVRSDWEQTNGDRISVYRFKMEFGGSVRGSTDLNEWASNGWNIFSMDGDQVWYAGVHYEMDKDLADEIRALARDIQRRQQEEAA